jgi:hypothetical protein
VLSKAKRLAANEISASTMIGTPIFTVVTTELFHDFISIRV